MPTRFAANLLLRASGLLAVWMSCGCARLLGADFEDKRARPELVDGGECLEILPGTHIPYDGLPDLWFFSKSTDFGDRTVDGGVAGDAIGLHVPDAGKCTVHSEEPTEPRSGIDNAYARAYTDFYANNGAPIGVVPSTSDLLTEFARNGDFSHLVRIRGYNGEREDDEVEVDFIDGSMGEPTRTDHPPPRLDGTDVWHPFVEQLAVTGGKAVPLVVATGSVHDFRIRATFTGAPVGLFEGTFEGTLEKDELGYHARDGVLSGALPVTRLLYAASVLAAGVGSSVCADSPLYAGPNGIKAETCSHLDVDTNGDGVCDALSVGALVDIEPIRPGCPFQYDTAQLCDESKDPRNDSCD